MNAIDKSALEQLFTEARTANGFTGRPVSSNLIRQVYDLASGARPR